jgi:hypothetical protein
MKNKTFLLHRAIINADNNSSLLNLSREGTFVVTTDMEKCLAWTQEALHEKHAHALSQPHIYSTASSTWLTWGELSPETRV